MKTTRKLSLLPPYLFAELERAKAEVMKQGKEVIDLGVGDPDLPPPSGLLEALKKALENPEYHCYPPYNGTAEFRRAVADYYRETFGVKLDPEKEILGLIGSKEGIAHLPFALLDEGDLVLVTDPGYPPYSSSVIMAGGKLQPVALKEENRFLPDLQAIPEEICQKAALFFLNYPNNPTGQAADLEFLTELVGWAKKHDIILAYDNAYADIVLEGKPLSILQVEGAKEIAIEFMSLSKPFNITGWRLAFAAGNPEILEALLKFKKIVDSGAFCALQEAGVYALTREKSFPEQMREIYRKRKAILVEDLTPLGWEFYPTNATFYLWGKVPRGRKSFEYCREVLLKTGVLITPGIGFGAEGEGYFRISLTCPDKDLQKAVAKIKENM